MSATASALHPNNPHQGRYDLAALVRILPELQAFIVATPKGDSIDFADAKAVQCLNRALLKQFYGIENWSVPPEFLCPPIPGRADYLHHAADLLAKRPVKRAAKPVRALDIGTGANLIYPIIGCRAFGWQMVGSDINPAALAHAQSLIRQNKHLHGIELRRQNHAKHIFNGIITADDYFDLTLCNPPFYRSAEQAAAQTRRKWKNLTGTASARRQFGGTAAELWCEGGEAAFLRRMVDESAAFAQQVGCFTTLVSNQDHLPALQKRLQTLHAQDVRTITMAQGQKRSHLLAWRF